MSETVIDDRVSTYSEDRVCAPLIFSKRLTPRPTVVFDTYWRFAAKRQEVFFARLKGLPQPWTDDSILSKYKFTNAYRASDRVSQFLIRRVIYSGKWSLVDTVFRILLFKIFNKIDTWELLERETGDICVKNFDVDIYDRVLNKALSAGASIYSAAYIIPSGSVNGNKPNRKHRFHLELLKYLIDSNLAYRLRKKKKMHDVYEELLEVNSFGRFLAYQFTIDLNYSNWFSYSENDFVVAGPGAKDGIKKCFSDLGEYTEEDVIHMMADDQRNHFDRLGIQFPSLWGRPLHLIDCQNLFCEVDKYSRIAHPEVAGVSGRTRIKQIFKPTPSPITVWYPPKWGINEKISY